ncbi:inactive serine/threonine-protein kinase VRK3 isoform X1 [Solea solea]|uniref:inactive serine/threonine-protein kinase VRK3 isoform X1 n=1 Tax=Solea solea TaxID=90069 RepID=UPI00272A1D00|nr:inactive serine/threonine-protein kinase VRK3 isoform X1 [Solea solea]
MPFHFCSQCGTKLEPDFRFCPSCGVKLPSVVDGSAPVSSNASLNVSPHKRDEVATAVAKEKLSSSRCCEPREGTVTTRPALQKTRNSLRLHRELEFDIRDAAAAAPPPPPAVVPSADPVKNYKIGDNSAGFHRSPVKQHTVTFNTHVEPTTESSTSPCVKSPRPVRTKAKPSSPASMPVEERKTKTRTRADESTVADSPDRSPVPSSNSRSPLKASGKSKAKKAKNATVEPLQEGEEVTDTTGRKWTLTRLSNQTVTDVIYEVLQTGSRSKESNHILKLGVKDGKIFNEQNFLQRAAKPSNVDKWIKQNKMDFLGIPSCVGFGLHADSYRFLIFPNMGQSLQSVLDEDHCLSEKTVLQLACRLLDVLQYVHSNEYVHADINADNIYITAGHTAQVYLVGYCHAYRYCPGGQHVEYRENSRTPHEGSIEFISLDAHKGAAPSRRSDLQSLGYCMLRWHTGTLPWKDLSRPDQVAASKQRFMDDVPALLNHCFGKTNVSRALQTYLSAVMCLQFSEQPDYSELKSGLRTVLLQMGGSVEQPLTF